MVWALHNSLKGWSLYDLTDREAQLVINSMSPNEQRLTQVCQQSKLVWEVLTKEGFPELFTSAGLEGKSYPPLNIKNSNSDVDTDYFVIKRQKVFYERTHVRVEIPLKAVIDGHNQQFETTTIDLSEGGVYFNDVIPDWVAGYFILRIYNEGQAYQVMCSLVEDQKDKKRVQIVSGENDPQFQHYSHLLMRLKDSQQKSS